MYRTAPSAPSQCQPGAPFVCTFSNRCFPTKAIRGWLGGRSVLVGKDQAARAARIISAWADPYR